jgi:type I restriction enzyme S subunit
MELVTFEKIIIDKTSGNKKFKQSEYLPIGKLAIIDQGQKMIAGYTNDISSQAKVNLPCILFGDHTRIFKYVDFPFALGADGVKILETSKFLHTLYAYFFLKQVKLSGKEGYNRNYKYLKEIKIPLPDFKTQQKIAGILEQVDVARQKRKQANLLTEQFLQSTFLEMFGDPARNEKGWEVKVLDDVCKKITDGTHFSPPNSESGEYRYITAKNIKKYGFDFKNLSFIDEKHHKEIYTRCNVEFGDVLYIKDGVTTGIAMVNTLKEEFSLLSSVALFKLNSKIDPQYLSSYLNNSTVYTAIRGSMGGAAITRLTIQKIRRIRILLPPLPLQQKYASLVKRVEQMREKQWKSENELDNLFRSLMQKYFG